MFTIPECQKLYDAAELLHHKGLLQTLSANALVCLLAIALNRDASDSLPHVAQRLGWSEKRTRRYLAELTDAKVANATDSQAQKSEHITPCRYHLASTELPSSETETPCCVVNKKNTTTEGGFQRGANIEKPRDRREIDPQRLTEKLKQVGLSGEAIQSILSDYSHERVARQLSWLKYRNANNPAGLLIRAIRDDWSPPQTAPDAPAQGVESSQKADETQAQLARIKSEGASQKRRHEKLVALEKNLSKQEREALRVQAEKQIRQRIGRSWPPTKPIPQTFLNAEYYRLIEAQFFKNKRT